MSPSSINGTTLVSSSPSTRRLCSNVRIGDAISVYEPEMLTVPTSTPIKATPTTSAAVGKKPTMTVYSLTEPHGTSPKLIRALSSRYDANSSNGNRKGSSSVLSETHEKQQQQKFFFNKLFHSVSHHPRTPANSFRRNPSSYTNTSTTEGEHSICESSLENTTSDGKQPQQQQQLNDTDSFPLKQRTVENNLISHYYQTNQNVCSNNIPVKSDVKGTAGNNNSTKDNSITGTTPMTTTTSKPIQPMSMAMPPSPFLTTKRYQPYHHRTSSSTAPPERRKFFIEKLFSVSKMHVSESGKMTTLESKTSSKQLATTSEVPDSTLKRQNNAASIFTNPFSGTGGRRRPRRSKKNVGPRITYSMDTNSSVGVTDDEDVKDVSWFSEISPNTVLHNVEHHYSQQPHSFNSPIVAVEEPSLEVPNKEQEEERVQGVQGVEHRIDRICIGPVSKMEHDIAPRDSTKTSSPVAHDINSANHQSGISHTSPSVLFCGSSIVAKEKEVSGSPLAFPKLESHQKNCDGTSSGSHVSSTSFLSFKSVFDNTIPNHNPVDERPTAAINEKLSCNTPILVETTTKDSIIAGQQQEQQQRQTDRSSSYSSALEWKQYFSMVLDNVTKIQCISKCSNMDLVRCDDDNNGAYKSGSTYNNNSNRKMKDACSAMDLSLPLSANSDALASSNHHSLLSDNDEDDDDEYDDDDVGTYDDSLLSTSLFDGSFLEEDEGNTYTSNEVDDNDADDYDTDYARFHAHRLYQYSNIKDKSLLDTTPSQQTDDASSYSTQNSAWL